MSYANTTVRDAADRSIKNERNLSDFCRKSFGEIKNQRGKYLLQYLAEYEQKHIWRLEQFKQKIIKEEILSSQRDASSAEDPGANEEFEKSNARIIELLNLSTEAEEKALESFSKLEHHIDDEEWKKAFAKLVEDEHLQNRMLYDEFYNINNRKGVYHWGD